METDIKTPCEVDRFELEQLKLVALGCSEELQATIRALLEKHGVHSWSLNEYLLTAPLPRMDDMSRLNSAVLYAPFLARRLDALSFLPEWGSPVEKVRLVSNSTTYRDAYEERLADCQMECCWLSETMAGKMLFAAWAKRRSKALGDLLLRFGATPSLLSPRAGDEFLLEYYLTDALWTLGTTNPDECACDLFAFPIASGDYFHGYLVLQFPPGTACKGPVIESDESLRSLVDDEAGSIKNELTPLGKQVANVLQAYVSDSYLPILVLCHNRLAERRLKSQLKKLNESSQHSLAEIVRMANPFVACSPDDPDKKPLDGTFEQILSWLWRQRVRWLEDHTADVTLEDARRAILESLRFEAYGIASSTMLKVITQVLYLPFRRETELNDRIDSVLVVGGPGSGKDNLARLVGLFCDGYTFATTYTFNMAAIRPQALVGPALQGIEPTGDRFPWMFPSILPRANPNSGGQLVIFDELNSIDIDQQGVLLRILENAEVTPLLSSTGRPYRVNFLCVGVMNEDPMRLMKEHEVRQYFTQSREFGSIVGTLVDEMFRRARRLRPDLFYRMTRQGVFVLPSLAERRHDIPLLFYGALPRNRRVDYRIDLAAYRALMDPTIPWRGNVRELQSVALAILRRATTDGNDSKVGSADRTALVRITERMVREVLIEHRLAEAVI